VTFEHARGDRVAPVLEELFALHSARWRVRGSEGVLADRRVQRFHHELAHSADQHGTLRLVRLGIGGATAGVTYGFTTPAGACTYISGFNPAFAACSPGSLLIRELVRRAIDEGVPEFDFLSGREAYKYQWGARDRRVLSCRLRHLRPARGSFRVKAEATI
jgi:CelD/BcsL family acetyltransferase involved in cellulose biosynthesis